MAQLSYRKKGIIGLALAALLWTGAGWQAPAASAAPGTPATPFSDVKAGHWAEKHIAKLSLQGLVQGKGDGLFDPNGNVSREEAVALAVRFVGKDDQVDKSGVVAFPDSFQVDNYFKPYVMFAMKNGLLDPDEEFGLAAKETGKPWGASPASREWIARLLVRAIGKDAEAAGFSGATSFADDASIDPALKGYVSAAVAESLVKGLPDNRFDPKAPVSRATAATLFSRAESKVQVAYPGQVSGILLSIAPDKLTMLHADGKISEFAITDATGIYGYNSETAATTDALKLYGQAIVISTSAGVASYVEQTDETPKVTTTEGTVLRVNTAESKLGLIVGDELQWIPYDPEHPPIVTDAENHELTIGDLKADLDVQVTTDTLRTPGRIIAVSVKQSLVNKTGHGVVEAVDLAKRQLTVKDDASGASETRTIAEQAPVLKQSIPVLPDALQVGDTVSYEVQDGVIVKIVIEKQAAQAVHGKLFKVDTAAQTIQYTDDATGQNAFMPYAPDVTVSIPGLADASLADLQEGDAITLTLDDAGKLVTGVAVEGRSVQVLYGAVIDQYIARNHTLSLTDASGAVHNPIVTSTTRFDLNGTKLSFDDAVRLLLVTGKKVNVEYSGDHAVSVTSVYKYEGTILENNVVSKSLKLQLADKTIVTVPYVNPTIEVYGTSSKSVSDLRAGDVVTVMLTANQDQAATVRVQTTAQLEVSSIDAAAKKLRTKRTDGTLEEWTITDGVPLQDDSGAAATLSQFASGDLVNITFVGKTPIAVKKVPVAYGIVVSVDASAGIVEIRLPSGETVKKTVGTAPQIWKDGVQLGSLASVKADDRVEIRQDEQNRPVVTIVPALNKTFWRSIPESQTIYFRTSGLTKESVVLDPKVYIHEGSQTLALGDLQDGDAISVYVLRGRAVEISR